MFSKRCCSIASRFGIGAIGAAACNCCVPPCFEREASLPPSNPFNNNKYSAVPNGKSRWFCIIVAHGAPMKFVLITSDPELVSAAKAAFPSGDQLVVHDKWEPA